MSLDVDFVSLSSDSSLTAAPNDSASGSVTREGLQRKGDGQKAVN